MKIFIIGSPRSGTNLLRAMLGQLPQLANPHPPQIIHRLMHFVNFYKDNFQLMVEDACRILELNYKPWPFEVEPKAIAQLCDAQYSGHLFAIAALLHDLYAQHEGKAGWVNKGMFNVFYADAIADYFPDAKFVYLYRDGRDVGLSMYKAIFGDFLYYFIAKHWHFVQQCSLSFACKYPRQCYRLSYETLTAEPETSCRNLCDFLELDYTPQMLEYHRSSEARESASASVVLANLARPVDPNNTQKFMREMSEEDLKVFESVAGDSLDVLGYKRVLVQKGEELSFSREKIDGFRLKNDYVRKLAWENYQGSDRLARLNLNAFLIEIGRRFGLDIRESIHIRFIAPSWYDPYQI